MAKLDVSLGLTLSFQDLEDDLTSLLSVTLGHFFEEVGDRLAQIYTGEVELHSLDEEQRFLEGQAFLVKMLYHELRLFDIERINVETKKSLQSVDLDDFVVVKAQLFRQGIKLVALEVVDVKQQ